MYQQEKGTSRCSEAGRRKAGVIKDVDVILLTISWIKRVPLTNSYALNLQVSVLEMDGQFDKLEELIYVESHLSNTSSKFYGEITQQMLRHADFPGSNNGTGLFQTIVGLKIREAYEKLAKKAVAVTV